MRETQPDTKHYFDIWHVAKSISKKVLKGGNEKGCEEILEWARAIRNHIAWCATSTKAGFGKMIIAKWNSFM